jgi:hypothetical protein
MMGIRDVRTISWRRDYRAAKIAVLCFLILVGVLAVVLVG